MPETEFELHTKVLEIKQEEVDFLNFKLKTQLHNVQKLMKDFLLFENDLVVS